MSDFQIDYKIGEGTKPRIFIIKDATDKMDASIRFQIEGPENAYVLHIGEVKKHGQKDKVHHKMIIAHAFDQLIFDQLKDLGKTNQELLHHLKMNRNTWRRLREHPEQIVFYEVMLIAQFFDLPVAAVTEALEDAINQNIAKGNFKSARSRQNS